MFTLWKPAIFQGSLKKKEYFEGWYFKLIDSSGDHALAIIAGISLAHDEKKSHAFIMVLNAREHHMDYFDFPLSQFSARKDRFQIKIGSSQFSDEEIILDVENITGHIHFKDIKPWPVKLFSPGAMGPFRFIPFMECYHGVLSMDHELEGSININQTPMDLNQGRGYMEKDWGSSMPSSWIWMQTNHFQENEVSLFGSIASIPWLGNYFTGYIFGFLYKSKLYQFTTYNGGKIKELEVNDNYIHLIITRKDCSLEIQASREEGVDLPAPSLGEMTSRVNESLNSKIKVKFLKNKEEIFSGTGRNSGLEFVGNIHELLKGLKNRS